MIRAPVDKARKVIITRKYLFIRCIDYVGTVGTPRASHGNKEKGFTYEMVGNTLCQLRAPVDLWR